ncbi:nucleoplasmin-3 [Anomaloglossus baeobatrachus]|uniref:nucleoplasmin-3 n=1 Tax=Anomaloglossus baeobatrachus TaxID=238106 RepID=UPI003F4F8721
MTSFLSVMQEAKMSSVMESYLFGCELSSKTSYYTFKVNEDDFKPHLSLSTICLGEGAKDEYNVVEVTARNHNEEEITVPIATLKLSCQTMINLDNFIIQPPVTFRLKSGSGPVQLSGQIIVATIDLDDDDDEEDEDDEEDDDDDDEDDEEELAPIKPVNKKMRN